MVVDSKYLCSLGLAEHQVTHPRIGRQPPTALLASLYKGTQVAAIVTPGMLVVVVGDRGLGIDRLSDRQMEVVTISLPVFGRPLAEIVEVVPDQLVGDQQSQQLEVARTGQRPEEGRPVRMGALVLEHI